MKASNHILSALACASLLAVQATAASVVITGDTADRETYTGPGWAAQPTAATMRVGAGGSAPHLERAAVYVFQLPTGLTAADISNVSFSTTVVTRAGTPTFNFDLYALDARSAKDVLTTDHYAGANDTRSGVTLIQDSFLTQDATAGLIATTSGTGNTALTSFVKIMLEAGKAGQWIFLRVNADINATGNGLNLASSDNTTVAVLPTLTITTSSIPEPGTLAVLTGAVALLAAFGLRVRRR